MVYMLETTLDPDTVRGSRGSFCARAQRVAGPVEARRPLDKLRDRSGVTTRGNEGGDPTEPATRMDAAAPRRPQRPFACHDTRERRRRPRRTRHLNERPRPFDKVR